MYRKAEELASAKVRLVRYVECFLVALMLGNFAPIAISSYDRSVSTMP